MLRIYKAPSGRLYQYEEGQQPEGYELHEPKSAKAKQQTPRNKARKVTTK